MVFGCLVIIQRFALLKTSKASIQNTMLSIFPDQEKLQGVDKNEDGIVKDQSILFDNDHPSQHAGTRDDD